MFKQTWVAIGLALCAILAFTLRMFPINYFAGSGDMLGAPDSWYNLRLVEFMLQNGQMLEFDPMTTYNEGCVVNWGFIFTGLGALFAIIAGAVTQVEIIDAISWLPPILASLCVIVMYFIGKKFGDWKTGLITALFTAIIGGQYFARSLYGLFDHHVAEVFFSCLFCLCYILALHYSQGVNIKKPSSLKLPILLGILAGLSYLLGLLTMTTLVVFGLFAMIFTIIQFIVNYHKNKSSDYLLIVNALMFLVAIIGLCVYGIKLDNLELTGYSLGFVFVQIIALASVVVLYAFTKIKKFKEFKYPTLWYVGSLVAISILVCIIVAIVKNDVFMMFFYNLIHQFTPASGGVTTIQEARAWSFTSMWSSFNIAVILALVGFCITCYNAVKKQNVVSHFLIWWTVGTFAFTCAQSRWEYYLSPAIALLSAIAVVYGINTLVFAIKTRKDYKNKKGKKRISQQQKDSNNLFIILGCCLILFGAIFTGISISNDVYLSDIYGQGGGTSANWIDACNWLKNNTPETGVNSSTVYDKNTFEYPEEAYGVIAWWDFGHFISVIGDRIAVANPFQSNVHKVANVLMATNESEACKLMDEYDSKYIMVDYNSGNNFIPVMAVWLEKQLKTNDDMYNTLAFRLYNLEGKANEAYNIPALEHFKLVYTSPAKSYGYNNKGQVIEYTTKIFEYVK